MDAPTDPTASTRRCAQCGSSTDLRTPHVLIEGNAVRAFCSAECATRSALPLPAPLLPAARPRRARALARALVHIGVSVPMLVFTSGHEPPRAPTASAAASSAREAPVEAEPDGFGPRWPPSEKDWLAEIGSDAWIHPLDGPSRRMPVSDGRVFGAERAGDRPGECKNGHCGVDLSGFWGEAVHAVHDGVVDRVQRGPNEEHGGLYVRLSHREGTIFSQYFHLAAIPRRIEPGVHVKVGELIGLLGDSGVKHSAAHLHFTLSVRPSVAMVEKYMDPEPLIALWPLRIAVGESSGMMTAHAAPGVPHGAATRRRAPRVAASHATEDAPAAE